MNVRCATPVAAILALAVTGCVVLGGDPGWTYLSPDGTAVRDDGVRYELPKRGEVTSRVHASFFAGSLSAELDIGNTSKEPLIVAMNSLVIRDSTGKRLTKRMELSTQRCGGQLTGTRCQLAQGESCRLAATFQAPPYATGLGGWFARRNPDLREIMVGPEPAPTHDSAQVGVNARLVWKD